MIIHRHAIIDPRAMVVLLRDASSALLAVLAAQRPARHARDAKVPLVEHAFLQELVYYGFLRSARGGFGHEAGVHEHSFGVEVGDEGEEGAEGEVEEGV